MAGQDTAYCASPLLEVNPKETLNYSGDYDVKETRKMLRDSVLNNLKVKPKVAEWRDDIQWPAWAKIFYNEVAAPTGATYLINTSEHPTATDTNKLLQAEETLRAHSALLLGIHETAHHKENIFLFANLKEFGRERARKAAVGIKVTD